MKIKEARRWNFILALLALVVFVLSRVVGNSFISGILTIMWLILIISADTVRRKFIRCSACDVYLGKMPRDINKCPYCGAKLE